MRKAEDYTDHSIEFDFYSAKEPSLHGHFCWVRRQLAGGQLAGGHFAGGQLVGGQLAGDFFWGVGQLASDFLKSCFRFFF